MTGPPIPEWIVTVDRLGALCKRCGRTEYPPRLPLPVDAYVLWARMVGEMHRFCAEPAAVAP